MFVFDHKVSAYLDQVDSDLATSCRIITSLGINSIVLRDLFGATNICHCSNRTYQQLKELFTQQSISVSAIYSRLEKPKFEDAIKSDFAIAAYFKSKSIIVPFPPSITDDFDKLNSWVLKLSHASIQNNITVLVELQYEDAKNIENINEIFKSNRRMKLLYDPAQLIMKHNYDQYAKLWPKAIGCLGAVDIRDYDTGKGPKLPGNGQSRLKDILRDIKAESRIELFLEPGFGCRYAGPLSFEAALKQFLYIFNGHDMPHNLNETIQKIKQAGPSSVRIVPMDGQPITGQYQIEISPQGSWVAIISGLTKQMAEDIVQQATNKVLLG